MIRTSIVVLALAMLAIVGCGDKGTKEGKTEKKAEETRAMKAVEPEPVKVPLVETEPEAEPVAVAPDPSPEPAAVEPDPSPEPATVDHIDLAALDLSAVDSTMKVIIMAPGGAAARDDYGAVKISMEPDFQMEFSEEEAVDFLVRKKEIEANGINKLKKYHVDTADTLVYETEIMGKPEFHFIATVKVGETLYLCEDQKGPVFSQAAVSAMLVACRSARLKQHALPMPALDGKPGPTMPAINLD